MMDSVPWSVGSSAKLGFLDCLFLRNLYCSQFPGAHFTVLPSSEISWTSTCPEIHSEIYLTGRIPSQSLCAETSFCSAQVASRVLNHMPSCITKHFGMPFERSWVSSPVSTAGFSALTADLGPMKRLGSQIPVLSTVRIRH